MKSIPTKYRGVTFASNLEADWAKTLDAMKVVWQYEPEGVRLPNGEGYRCDLYLPRISTWLEVKGPHNQRLRKPGILADAVIHAPGCSTGNPASVRPNSSGLGCACGFGPSVPHQFVLVGRPATGGKLTFEAAHSRAMPDQLVVAVKCHTCQQFSFIDHHGEPVCRRCWSVTTGSTAYPSRSLPFYRIATPVRGRAS